MTVIASSYPTRICIPLPHNITHDAMNSDDNKWINSMALKRTPLGWLVCCLNGVLVTSNHHAQASTDVIWRRQVARNTITSILCNNKQGKEVTSHEGAKAVKWVHELYCIVLSLHSVSLNQCSISQTRRVALIDWLLVHRLHQFKSPAVLNRNFHSEVAVEIDLRSKLQLPSSNSLTFNLPLILSPELIKTTQN
jgi:hypothetical protein